MTDMGEHPRQGKAGRPYKAEAGGTLNRAGMVWSAVPGEKDFEAADDADFLPAPALEELATKLIGEYPELGWVSEYEVRYLWKAKGGKQHGAAPILGKCVLASGLVKFLGEQTWVIWLAADWCREFELGADQVEAVLYHELLHATLREGKEGEEKKPAIRPHDFEGFAAEIRRYGFHDTDMKTVKEAVQARLKLEFAEATT